MITIRAITVVLDPTVIRDSVLDRAIMLARSTKAKLIILINCYSILGEKSYFPTDKSNPGAHVKRELQEQILQSITKEIAGCGVTVSFDVFDSESVVEAIVKRVVEIGADLVLKSTHHHSELRKSFFTNTDWQLIRQCPVPLWFSKAGHWLERGAIVAAVDPLHGRAEQSSLDALLVNYAEYLAQSIEQTACVFHAFYAPDESKSSIRSASNELVDMRRQHNQAIYKLLASHNISPENVQITMGGVRVSLLAYLHHIRSNLLIIGALSRNRLERAILGNTAENILDESPCDVLVLRPASPQ